jgi:hypothetical protein
MTETFSGDSTSSTWDRWAPWGFSVFLLALGLGIWEVFPPGIWHDDGVYVLLGKSLAEGEGLRYLGVPGMPLAPKFPPLYPLVLSWVWRLAPNFPENAGFLGGLNLLLVSAAGGLFLGYLRRGLGLPLSLAVAISLLTFVSPPLWRVVMVPLSEPQFILIMVVALWAGIRLERERGWPSVALFLLAGGLAFYTRSVGVAILLGGVGSLVLQRRIRAAFGALLGTLVLILPWILWSRWAARALPESMRDILGSYGGWFVGEMLRDPLAYGMYLLENGGHLLARVLSLLLPGVVGWPLWLGMVLVPFLVVGLLEVGRKTPVLPLTLLLSLGILLIWPFQDIRLLVPFHPILVLGVVLGFWRLLGLGALPKRGRIPIGALAGGWALLVLGVSGYRLVTGWPGQAYRVRSDVLSMVVRSVEERTPPDAVIGAPEFWPGIYLFTGRAVVPSARFLPLGGDDPTWGSPKAQHALWIEGGVTHILVEDGGRIHGAALEKVAEICPPGTVQVLDRQVGHVLVALRWDADCRAKLMEER